MRNRRPDVFLENVYLCIQAILASLSCVGLLLLYRALTLSEKNSETFASSIFTSLESYRAIFLIVFFVGAISFYFCFRNKDLLCKCLYRWRWPVALFLLIVLVVLNVSGSSIGCWVDYLPNGDNPGLLLGTARPVRSDEFLIATPQNFSQLANPESWLQYYSTVARGSMTDMNIFYAAPMWDFAQLFRPFQWGYLFLGAERGLSFWWCSRLILLFMVSFEIGMLLSKKNKHLAVAYAFLVTFSPAVQWWYGSGSITDCIVYGQIIVLLAWSYCKSRSYKTRSLLIFPLIICAGSFIMTFYPAWLVGFGYLVLVALVVVVVYWRRSALFRPKLDIPILGVGLLLLALSIMFVLVKSSDTVLSLFTSAQGTRELGKGELENLTRLFFYPFSIFFPFTQDGIAPNVCEVSGFYNFFPLGLIMSIYVMVKQKKVDIPAILFLVVILLFTLYYIVPLPDWLQSISLLRFTTITRTTSFLGFANLLLLIRAIVLCANGKAKVRFAYLSIVALVLTIWIIAMASLSQPDYTKLGFALVSAIFLFVGIVFIAEKKSRQFAVFCIVVSMLGGFLVNPIQIGTAIIYENDLEKMINKVASEHPESKWVVETEGSFAVVPQLAIMAGAPTINSVNTYPNADLWSKIDPDQEYREIWNRYAIVGVDLIDGETNFELKATDMFDANININDLSLIDVSYVLSRDDPNEISGVVDVFKPIDTYEGWTIWERENKYE